MMQNTTPKHRVHEGRNIKRFREMLGIKQDALAADLGHDWNQQRVSLLEQRETIELAVLQQVANVLHLPIEALQNFDEDEALNIIANTFGDNAFINHYSNFGTINFHPVDKIMQLHEEKIALYERMLQEKEDMMKRLEELIKK